jgi:hypothetical protein
MYNWVYVPLTAEEIISRSIKSNTEPGKHCCPASQL